MATKIDYDALLNAPGPDGCRTIREWLGEAMKRLIEEDEGFSGKRPLGDSGWGWAFDEAKEKYAPKAGPSLWDDAIDHMLKTVD